MNTQVEMLLWFELSQALTRYWADVNHNNGKQAHEFYEIDGFFSVGEKRHSGRAGIREFYQWRASRGARIARHLLSNILVTLGDGPDDAVITGSVCLFASDGVPVLESGPPTMVADFRVHCVRDGAQRWLFRSHVLTPLFRGAGRLGVTTQEPERR